VVDTSTLVPVEDSAAKWAAAFEVAGAGLGLHLVGNQDVLVALHQVFFLEAQVGVAVRLIHGVPPGALFVQAGCSADGRHVNDVLA
jgi:hypothetical protein